MDRFHEMRVFVTVAGEGGFSAAARRLELSGPAVTRAVAALEERIGARLLHRTTRSVQLTAAGTRFVEDCRRILSEVEEAEGVAAGLHAEPQGELTVTAPQTFGRMYVAPILLQFLSRYPKVSARTLFVDRVVSLTEEGVDVAVRIGDLPDSALRAAPVGQVRRMLCAAPAYWQRCGIPTHPLDLNPRDCIQFTGTMPSRDLMFFDQGRAHTLKTEPRLAAGTFDMAVGAAVAGFGYVRLLSYSVVEYVRRGELQVVLDPYEPLPLPVHVLHHEGRRVSAKVRAFFDYAVEALRRNAALGLMDS